MWGLRRDAYQRIDLEKPLTHKQVDLRHNTPLVLDQQRIGTDSRRFDSHRVQPGSVDRAPVKGFYQIVLVDDASPSCIDENGGRFHHIELRLADHVLGRWQERNVKRDDVCNGVPLRFKIVNPL